MFKPVKPKRVVEYIVEQIESEIKNGNLPPGSKLPSERELARLFEVSRSSVREALNILQAKGLISSSQGEGTFVRSLTETILGINLNNFITNDPKYVWDLVEIRKIIELWAVRKACEVADENDLKLISEAYAELENDYKLKNYGDESDAEFHFSIIKATKNTILIHLMGSIFKLLKCATNIGKDYEFKVRKLTKEQLLKEHEDILKAVLKRDSKLAYDKMSIHLSYIGDDFKRYLFSYYKKHPVKNKGGYNLPH